MSYLSIRNMNRTIGERELDRVADTAGLPTIFYWWVERRSTGKVVSDFHRTKRATADLWRRVYQQQGKKYRLRMSKARFQ